MNALTAKQDVRQILEWECEASWKARMLYFIWKSQNRQQTQNQVDLDWMRFCSKISGKFNVFLIRFGSFLEDTKSVLFFE